VYAYMAFTVPCGDGDALPLVVEPGLLDSGGGGTDPPPPEEMSIYEVGTIPVLPWLLDTFVHPLPLSAVTTDNGSPAESRRSNEAKHATCRGRFSTYKRCSAAARIEQHSRIWLLQNQKG